MSKFKVRVLRVTVDVFYNADTQQGYFVRNGRRHEFTAPDADEAMMLVLNTLDTIGGR